MLEIRLQVGRIRLWIFHNSTNYIDTPGPSGSFLFTTFPPASMLPSISLGHSSRVHRVENSEIQVEIFHHVLIWLGQWGIPRNSNVSSEKHDQSWDMLDSFGVTNFQNKCGVVRADRSMDPLLVHVRSLIIDLTQSVFGGCVGNSYILKQTEFETIPLINHKRTETAMEKSWAIIEFYGEIMENHGKLSSLNVGNAKLRQHLLVQAWELCSWLVSVLRQPPNT